MIAELASTFVFICFLVGCGILIACAIVAIRDFRDGRMQRRKRDQNRKFDARVGRDCFLDRRGIWK